VAEVDAKPETFVSPKPETEEELEELEELAAEA